MTGTTTPMRAALYSRVSTSDQNVAGQREQLQAYATARGLTASEYTDEGVSGARDSRPALDEMMAAARRRDVDVVVVTKLDRLARSVRHLLEMAASFEALGVDLVVLDQQIDTSTPSGRLMFTLLGAFAEFERELILERTRVGVQRAKRRGVKFGRKEVTDRRSRDRITRLAKAGRSHREIAGLVGVGRTTVGKVLAERKAA